MIIQVQSFLNSGNILPIQVLSTTTFDQLKLLVYAVEGTTSTIMTFSVNNQLVTSTTSTMAEYSISSDSLVNSSNNLSQPGLWTKQQRQQLKLDLAALRRQADGDTTAPFYRVRNNYDITELPTVYAVGDNSTQNVTDNPNVGGLVYGRPWI